MIEKNYVWMISSNPNNIIDTSTAGKWIVKGKNFRKIFKDIDKLVNQGIIYKAKYTHKEFPWHDPLPLEKPVLCVYADDKTKESTYNEMLKLGIEPVFWKYNAETANDWSENGKLKQKSEIQKFYFTYMQMYKERDRF